ncbi:MAG: inorganic phosphate transporter family protein [Gammaproteobacteria bacterium]|nr:inorganic phosphate transporter family protein [Gammaproteobacteria bacterium]MBU1654824.1 inorganic phosphate transporter family protein [Gammaproteobacteria bacterium]MBU1961091.1 inorganic phosphate transporter family protein [Gammaproteobacteria bacterium]
MLAPVLLGTFWLAWSNGANDNFKGVATLYGSGVLSFRAALAWATVATVSGSLVSVWLAQGLVLTFSGSGLIPAGTLNGAMLAAVGIGAGTTVWLATRIGMPTSTTHALTGALVGAALVANAQGIQWAALGNKFAQPLLLSPLLAIGLTLLLYPALSLARRQLGIQATNCLCLGEARTLYAGASTAMLSTTMPKLATGDLTGCAERYEGRFVGVQAQTAANALHVLSAGSVCFARAVNDTPKIAALLLGASALGSSTQSAWVIVLIALAMAAGGLLQSGRVAETLSRRITDLGHGQGLTANLVTAGLVLGASHLGLPVSTTHVATGAIFGIGAVNGKRDWRTIGRILLTWVSTLPLGLALGAGLYWLGSA